MLHSDTLSRVGKSSVLSRLSHIQCNHRALLRQIWERHLLNPYPCCFPMCRSFPAQAMEALPGPSVTCLGIACPGDFLLQLSRADHHLSPRHYAQSSTSWGDYPCGKMSLEFLHFGCSLDWYPPPWGVPWDSESTDPAVRPPPRGAAKRKALWSQVVLSHLMWIQNT